MHRLLCNSLMQVVPKAGGAENVVKWGSNWKLKMNDGCRSQSFSNKLSRSRSTAQR